MSNGGIPLSIIQEISGHRDLGQLQRYLEVQPEQVRGAIASLSMLSPSSDKIFQFSDFDSPVEVNRNKNNKIKG